MIGVPRGVRAWAYPGPVDLRKGFDGLQALVTAGLGRSPLSGDYFLFCNRTRRSAKVLVWDGTGLVIYHKRLERGRFACLWSNGRDAPAELTSSELALYIEGCELVGKMALSPAPFPIGSRAA